MVKLYFGKAKIFKCEKPLSIVQVNPLFANEDTSIWFDLLNLNANSVRTTTDEKRNQRLTNENNCGNY